jgi:dTDP-4-dehydrorhamnose 3,5-epimerase
MRFSELRLAGAYAIELDIREDERGFFARFLCEDVLASHGLQTHWPQMNTSFSHAVGTLRGLHFQRPPMADAKIVRCIAGAVFDVIVDLRAGSETFGQWVSLELKAKNRNMVYIPAGFAHGFQTLLADTELLYLHSAPFSPEHDAGIHHSDPALSIEWPMPPAFVSPRDRSLPRLAEMEPMRI